jgi:hypothetical protein
MTVPPTRMQDRSAQRSQAVGQQPLADALPSPVYRNGVGGENERGPPPDALLKHLADNPDARVELVALDAKTQ